MLRGGTQRSILPRYQSKEMKILNISFPPIHNHRAYNCLLVTASKYIFTKFNDDTIIRNKLNQYLILLKMNLFTLSNQLRKNSDVYLRRFARGASSNPTFKLYTFSKTTVFLYICYNISIVNYEYYHQYIFNIILIQSSLCMDGPSVATGVLYNICSAQQRTKKNCKVFT